MYMAFMFGFPKCVNKCVSCSLSRTILFNSSGRFGGRLAENSANIPQILSQGRRSLRTSLEEINHSQFWRRIRVIAGSSIGFALTFGSTWMMARERANFKLIPCVNAIVAEEDDYNDFEGKAKKRSMQFNFIADAVESAAPAVVYIQVTSNKYRGRFMGNIGPTSSGSGFFVTNDGMILTNAHVVADAMKVEVKMPDGNKYEGVVVDIDPVTDLAAVQLIETSNVKFPYLHLGDSSKLRAGEWVAALGSPLTLSNTITAGIISSLHRGGEELGLRNREMKYIQTDAAINVGNSGGPLVNLDGEVVGINCITVMAASGISFAIPSDMARDFMTNAKERVKTLKSSSGLAPLKFKSQERFYIGISMLTLTPGIAEELRQRSSRYSRVEGGVFVASVSRGSPADRAGLRTGDVIVAVKGNKIQNSKEIYDAVGKGEKIELEIIRGTSTIQIDIKPEIAGKL